MQAAECNSVWLARLAGVEGSDAARAHLDRTRPTRGMEPERGERTTATKGLHQRGRVQVRGDIRIDEPERFVINKPRSFAQRSAGSKNVRLERERNSKAKAFVLPEKIQDIAGLVMQVDEHIAHAPTGKHFQRVLQERLAPQRHERLREIARQGEHPGAIPGGEDNGAFGA